MKVNLNKKFSISDVSEVIIKSAYVDENDGWFDQNQKSYASNLYGGGECTMVLRCQYNYHGDISFSIDGDIYADLYLFHSYDDTISPEEPDVATIDKFDTSDFYNKIREGVKKYTRSTDDRDIAIDIFDAYLEVYDLLCGDNTFMITKFIYDDVFPKFDLNSVPDDTDYDYEAESYDREMAYDEQEYQIGKSLAEQGMDTFDEEY